jgi:hypothetical protein
MSDAFVFNEVQPVAEGAGDDSFIIAPDNAKGAPDREAAPDRGAAPSTGFDHFPEIVKILAEQGIRIFDDPSYYKTVMGNGGEPAKRLHAVYQKFAQAKDPQDKTLFRQQLINIYWDFLGNAALDVAGNISEPRKFLLRFGMLNPNALLPETKMFFSKVISGPSPEPSVIYLDEWLRMIGLGEANASTTDEVKTTKGGNSTAHFRALLDKAKGKFEGAQGLLRNLNQKRKEMEGLFMEKAALITGHAPCIEFEEVDSCYADDQKKAMFEIQELMKNMTRTDREMTALLNTLVAGKEELAEARANLERAGADEAASADTQAIGTEFQSIRQMAKMTVGRQGNAFPFLTGEYFHCPPNATGTRENIIKLLTWIESIDCEAFQRRHKNQINRIVPYVLLLPTYGDFGVCWEPYNKMNKTTSRGRVAVPMYPKNLTVAVLTAIGDYRWQFAKEAASFYWMEEGLTGNYYQWFQAQKLKGDVKMYFIQDYIMWMTKEAEGTQKLDKEVRGIFWRFMPFAQSLKDRLKDRNLVYQELYQRDKNRTMSDGY